MLIAQLYGLELIDLHKPVYSPQGPHFEVENQKLLKHGFHGYSNGVNNVVPPPYFDEFFCDLTIFFLEFFNPGNSSSDEKSKVESKTLLVFFLYFFSR
jgi:hypothetical protein